jgi:DNA end-binding protein Ku
LAELLAKKQKGLPIAAVMKPAPDNVVNLMDALRASIASSGALLSSINRAEEAAKPKRKAG